jgi:uncharacterized protein
MSTTTPSSSTPSSTTPPSPEVARHAANGGMPPDAASEAEWHRMMITSLPGPADPAPLGLAAFALTTFLLSAQNATWMGGTSAWLGYALAYGGLVQLLAAMWEFRNRNVFGATAFGTYGGFWIGLGLFWELVVPTATAGQIDNDLAWIALAFLVVNTYLMLCSVMVNASIVAVFVALEATLVVLMIGYFNTSTTTLKVGGIVGVVTAAIAWYASFAGLTNGMFGKHLVPVGKPFVQPAMPAAPAADPKG